jgi:AcrR family transcriptional regulator
VTEPSQPSASLRDRKREKLNRTILDVSLRLFLTRGYDRTTLEQVCEEAETSLRTLLRYFPSKEVLALGREYAALEDFREAIGRLAPGVSVIGFWRERISLSSQGVETKQYLARLKMFDSAPAIEAKMLSLQVTYEDLLAEAFAREAGFPVDEDLHSRLLAGMLIAGNRAASRRWVASNGKLNLGKLREEVIDWAMQNFPAPPKPAASAASGKRRTA